MLDAENPDQGPDQTTLSAPAPEATSTDPAPGAAPETVAGPDAGAGPDPATTEATTEPGTEAGPDEGAAPAKKTAKKAAAKKTTKKAAAKKTTTRKTAAKKAAVPADGAGESPEPGAPAEQAAAAAAVPAEAAAEGTAPEAEAPARKTAKKAAKKTTKRTTAKKTAGRSTEAAAGGEAPAGTATPEEAEAVEQAAEQAVGQDAEAATEPAGRGTAAAAASTPPAATSLLFQPPDPTKAVTRKKSKAAPREDETAAGEQAEGVAPEKPARKTQKKTAKKQAGKPDEESRETGRTVEAPAEPEEKGEGRESDESADQEGEGGGRRRRRRGGRRRRRSGEENGQGGEAEDAEDTSESETEDTEAGETGGSSRRRRRRRRAGDEGDAVADEPANTVTRVRKGRSPEDEITALTGSTRLEAKKQRRREGREAGRRRAPIVSEAEFLARREAVDRVMVIRQKKDLTQIAVLEDKVLVEHYVARESQTSLIGNVYLGRVQNVLPSMEAAFIDIGKGRNAVLYAGEVNWDALGAGNGPRKIESVLKSGQSVLVQVTKDPVGHKGARLTSQVSLPGRFLVYVPDGTTSGISRKLPDTERNRLKTLLKEIVPDSAGVIVRTAAEGASEDELTRDVERLTARWDDIQTKVAKGNAPQLLYGEPDLTLKVVRDLFTEDFGRLVVSGGDAWEMVEEYVSHVAPDLAERLERYDGDDDPDRDVFADFRIDEQIAKALDRKVWLPSGGSLIIDRTEAMTVVDVNTGKFTGSGGNLEETVTKNNLEAAEEIVRQLRLRDIGGIIVVDFIDMVLESNRDLVLRRMVECLGRDRTRHQVAEVTSLGLVQMTRKRIGTGLLEAFSESCEHCGGRGLIVHHEPIEPKKKTEEEPRRGGGRRGGRGRGKGDETGNGGGNGAPSPKDIAAMARAERPQPEGAAPADEKVQTDEKVQADGKPTADEKPSAGERRAEREQAEQPAAVHAASAEEKPVAEEGQGEGRSGRRRRGRGRPEQQAGDGAGERQPDDQPSLLDTADEVATDVDAGEPSALDKVVAGEAATGAEVTTGAEAAPEPPAGTAEEAQQPSAVGAAAPAAPRTVTRKRSARRAQGPAGTPAVVTTAPASVDGAGAEAAPVSPDETTTGTSDEEAAPTVASVAVAAAGTTRVVATQRRRSARREAGPPTGHPDGDAEDAGHGSDQAEPAGHGADPDPAAVADSGTGSEDPGHDAPSPEDADTAAVEEPQVPAHVPIKRKGSRKR